MDQRIAETEARLTRLRQAQASEVRKTDTRRKILAGAVVLAHAGRDPEWGERLRALLDSALTTERDRALFGLDPLP
ncbi:mobilization protein C [Azospirillum argentinense]